MSERGGRSLHEEVCSDARNLAHEISSDPFGSEEEIADAIEAGFIYRERRLRADIERLTRDSDRLREEAAAHLVRATQAEIERDEARGIIDAARVVDRSWSDGYFSCVEMSNLHRALAAAPEPRRPESDESNNRADRLDR